MLRQKQYPFRTAKNVYGLSREQNKLSYGEVNQPTWSQYGRSAETDKAITFTQC